MPWICVAKKTPSYHLRRITVFDSPGRMHGSPDGLVLGTIVYRDADFQHCSTFSMYLFRFLPRIFYASLSLSTGTMFATQGVGPISSRSKIPISIFFSISLPIASLRWNGIGRRFCRMSFAHLSFPLKRFGKIPLNSSLLNVPHTLFWLWGTDLGCPLFFVVLCSSSYQEVSLCWALTLYCPSWPPLGKLLFGSSLGIHLSLWLLQHLATKKGSHPLLIKNHRSADTLIH